MDQLDPFQEEYTLKSFLKSNIWEDRNISVVYGPPEATGKSYLIASLLFSDRLLEKNKWWIIYTVFKNSFQKIITKAKLLLVNWIVKCLQKITIKSIKYINPLQGRILLIIDFRLLISILSSCQGIEGYHSIIYLNHYFCVIFSSNEGAYKKCLHGCYHGVR